MVAGYTATRLQAHTKVAQRTILVDAATHARLPHPLAAEALGAVRFHGKAAPIEVLAVASG